MRSIVVETNSIPIRVECDNVVLNTEVVTYGIRVYDDLDWEKVKRLIETVPHNHSTTQVFNESGDMTQEAINAAVQAALGTKASITYVDQSIAAIKPDHTIDTASLSGKVVITKGTSSYAIDAELIQRPAVVTLTAGGTFTRSKSVSMSCATSGVTIRYTMTSDGTEPEEPTSSSAEYSSAITLSQDTSVQTKVYKIKAKAFKNGMESETTASATYNINRQVTTPTVSNATGNKYFASRSVTISCDTSGATMHYTTDGSTPTTSSPIVANGGTVTLNTKGTFAVKAIAILTNWENSAVASKTDIVIGAGKCYIGQAASIASESDIANLANSYERDTMVGWTAPTINFGTTTQYVWFCIPNTAARNLTVKSEGFGVTLDNAAGTIVGGYRVWRTANKINSSFTFQFS